MSTLSRYFVILLIAFFSVATSGAVAMAHCDNSAQGRDNSSIEKKMDGCSHSHSTEGAKHGDHKNADQKTHSCCNAGSNGSSDPTSHDNESQTTSCIDCGAGLCHTQNVVTVKTTTVFYATLSDFVTSKNINLAAVFLTIIPDPPNSIS
ncbi:hypothetical protein MNBD_DELTA01-1931 [hydrothermal vent metagenome]|uniref:Uncharacterized protein n=1 Tax=hydrothermal vent metagenome TaxID=652676 RepID=A0A3B0R8Q7_9ZZZZ